MELYDRYRFYTEDTRYGLEASNELDKWVSANFPQGATIIACDGVWYGGREMSLIIEVITKDRTVSEMEELAKELRDFNKQDAVLLTRDNVRADFY